MTHSLTTDTRSSLTLGKPRYLTGFAVLFWGFQSDLWWFAVPMALILEARYFLNRRWALTKTDFYRVADLTGLAMAGVVLYLFMNRQEYHFITTLLTWLPIGLFPLVTVFAYSTTPRMPLDVLFLSLRRQREEVQQSWDMDYLFLGSCLVAAGLNREGVYYFPIVAGVVMLALYRLRSPRFRRATFVLSMCVLFMAATFMHHGIREAHIGIKQKTEQWIANWISERTDPMRTRTAIGQVGRLKLSDAIQFRIAPASGKPDFPPLLQEAAYNSPSDNDWEVFDPRFNPVEHADDFRWEFTDEVNYPFPEAKVYIEFDRERALVPVPAELAELNELPASDVTSSAYGTIQAIGLIPAPYYRLRYDDRIRIGDPPGSVDLIVPDEFKTIMQSLDPGPVSQAEALDHVRQFFSSFRYTLYQPKDGGSEAPLRHFLLTSQAGHCEYFASATSLMLRYFGIPTRYVVGFSVQEWNPDMEMYIVRDRHAHAWTLAWINDRWIAVDNTPTNWLGLEESNAGLLQPMWDFFGNNLFLFQRWWADQKIEDYEMQLYILGFILVLVLIGRIATSEQVIIEESGEVRPGRRPVPGTESPFFRIETHLATQGYGRAPGELMTRWLIRIDRPELLPMLGSHNRWRFDPRGISMDDRIRLADQVDEWLGANQPLGQ